MAFGRHDADDAEAHGSQCVQDTAIRVVDIARFANVAQVTQPITPSNPCPSPKSSAFGYTPMPMCSTTPQSKSSAVQDQDACEPQNLKPGLAILGSDV